MTIDYRRGDAQARAGFTLIEVLVVIAIIALLMAILMPTLAQVRAEARAARCKASLNDIGKAVNVYLLRERKFPVSYAYLNAKGMPDISPEGQNAVGPDHPNGYVHWSWFLYSDGKVDEKAFQCPDAQNGGAPRTNPGPKAEDWEPDQADDNGQSTPNPHVDLQAPRMAYTANAAIMPRNKFTRLLSKGHRVNQFVGDGTIKRASNLIMIGEFNRNWEAVAVAKDTGVNKLLSKSHRPVNPFYNKTSGSDEYSAPDRKNGPSHFVYGVPGKEDFGLLPYGDVVDQPSLIESPVGELNALGRHHPGGGPPYGGTANFAYADGHIEGKTVLSTLEGREWGDHYYSLSGNNTIEPN